MVARQARHPDSAVVQKGTAAATGGKQFIPARIVNNSLNDLPTVCQRNGNGVYRIAVDKIACAVERVDNPLVFGYAVDCLPGLVQTRLFTQESMFRIGCAQHVDYGLFNVLVYFRDIIFRPLTCHVHTLEVETGPVNDGAGAACRLNGGVKHGVHKIPFLITNLCWLQAHFSWLF